MRTKTTKKSEIKREWHLIDAKDQILGRLAGRIALFLMGKTKPYYVANLDCGDYVVVTNAAKVKVTGKKELQKNYYRHSGYPGGFKQITLGEQRQKDPTKIIEHAISGMLPKNKLRDPRLARLKVFKGEEHDYGDKFKNQKSDVKK